MSINWKQWFRQVWPFEPKHSAVIGQYASLKLTHGLMLTDIAIRNGLYAEQNAGNLYEAGINEGRRRAALEIIKLANCSPDDLYGLAERKPRQGD